MEEAQAELATNNKNLLTSNAQAGPSSISDIFQGGQQPSTTQHKPPAYQPCKSSPIVNATSQPPLQPPPSLPQPPTPPVCDSSPHILPPDQPPITPRKCVPVSPLHSNASDSEGLAPSLGEESLDSIEEDPLFFPPSNSHIDSLTTEDTMAVVKQAFFLHTRGEKLTNFKSSANVKQARSFHPPLSPLPINSASSTRPSSSIPTTLSYQSSGVEPSESLPQEEVVRRAEPHLPPENKRRPDRERARSPHALPHPLEHYQRFLRNGESHLPLPPRPSPPPVPTHPYARSATDDLDTRIARLLEAATPHTHQRVEFQPSGISSPQPPPPPPPLPPSQNLILTHRSMPPQQQVQHPPQSHYLPIIPAAVQSSYTPASPVPEGPNDDRQYFDPLGSWPPQQSGQDPDADVLKSMGA